jgi:hypothetical protein
VPFSNEVLRIQRWLAGVGCLLLLVVACTSKSEVSIPKMEAERPTGATPSEPRGVAGVDTHSSEGGDGQPAVNRVLADCPISTLLAAASSPTDGGDSRPGEIGSRPLVACFDGDALVASPKLDSAKSNGSRSETAKSDLGNRVEPLGGGWLVSYLSRSSTSEWAKVGRASYSAEASIDVVNIERTVDPIDGVSLTQGVDDGPPDCQVLADLYGNCEDSVANVDLAQFPAEKGGLPPQARIVVRSGNGETRVFYTAISQTGCEPCAGGIGAVSYRRAGGVWNPEDKVPALAQLGRTGLAPEPIVVWRSGWRTLALFSSLDQVGGALTETLTVLGFNGQFLIGFEDILRSTKGKPNCSPVGTADCFASEGEIDVFDSDTPMRPEFPAVVIRRSGSRPTGLVDDVTTYEFDAKKSRFVQSNTNVTRPTRPVN